MNMTPDDGWRFMQDGVVFGTLNRQGGPRGDTEFIAQNWWMGMWSRKTRRQELTVMSMFSLDPATVGKSGYSEIFQVGETLNGRPLVDRQHPHDLIMQLGVVWRVALGRTAGLTVGGGPVGEPALGPVAFMHRPSSLDNPSAPLSHHTLDSTHVSMGVINVGLDRGPWIVEGSLFNGREPDEQRWDVMDPGPLESWASRLWFRPDVEWEAQFSYGRLKAPEKLEAGDIRRTTGSVAWFRSRETRMTAVFVGVGRNATGHGSRNALLIEAARRSGPLSLYSRLETVQVETSLLRADRPGPSDAGRANAVSAVTAGATWSVLNWRGFEGAFGGDVTFYRVPESLQSTHGAHPASFHLFFRVRPPAGAMGRVWNMRMTQPLLNHTAGQMDHAMD